MNTIFIRRILEYILVVCIILEFNTPYMVFPLVKRIVQIFPIIVLLILLLISNYSILKKVNLFVLIYLIGSLFPMLVISEHNYPAYIIRYCIILPLLWIYLSLRKDADANGNNISLFLRYSNTVVILAVISLFMWLFCSILQIIPPTAFIPNDWAPGRYFIPTYYGIYFETQSVSPLGETIMRNTGIFNEGPMYNMVLCTAFVIEYFIRPKKSPLKIWILAIAIVSTITTTGQFFLLGIGCLTVYRNIGQKYRAILIIVIPALLYISYSSANQLLENKMETGGDSSVELRAEDIEYCIEVGMENPFLGVGLVISDGEKLWRGEAIGRSNSLFAVFARGGVFALTLYLGTLIIIPYLYYRKNKDSAWLLAMLFFFLLFNITSAFLKYLTFLFMAWGMSKIELKAHLKNRV